MMIDEFWSIIDESRAEWDRDTPEGNQERRVRLLERLLLQLLPPEVESFERHLIAQLYRAYRWDLWDAASILADGCSDDFFAYSARG